MTLPLLRRHAAKIIVVTLLAIPALMSMHSKNDVAENRKLAELPPRPDSWKALLETPAKLNAWVDDHFGFRAKLLRANSKLRFLLFHEFPSTQMTAGQHGRYFLSSHNAAGQRYLAMTAVCGKLGTALPSTLPYLNQMFDSFKAANLQPKLLIVPSAAVVHAEDTPDWMMKECMAPETPVTAVLKSPELKPEAASSILFPVREMREIKKHATLYPNIWFHWTGTGLDQVARLSLTHFWQRPLDVAPPLATTTYESHSDVFYLFEGIKLMTDITRPDMPASQVKECWGEACFPELREIPKVMVDVSRYHNPKAPPRRLLMVTDSFGSKISPWYARYYRDVEHFATNNVMLLNPDQLARLKSYIYRNPADTDILFLYHDGGAAYDTLRVGTHRLLPDPAKQADIALRN